MSTFLLLTMSRFLGGFGFWWTDDLAERAEKAAAVKPAVEAVVYARTAGPVEEEHQTQAGIRIETHDGISNGF